MRDYVRVLTTLPERDVSFEYVLKNYASIDELKQALSIMEQSPKGNKKRIEACARELRKREKRVACSD